MALRAKIAWLSLGALLSLGAAAEDMAAGTPAAGIQPGTATEVQAEARAALLEMAQYLGSLDKFSVTIRGGFDVLQTNGQKIQFLEKREVTVDRPNRMRMRETLGDGNGSDLAFDGTKMTLWNGVAGVYAQADQPGTLDDAIVYFIRDLRMRMPLAPIFLSRLGEELDRSVKSVDYVETTNVFGVESYQLAARTDVLDFQVWIADSDRPLLQRMVITYRHEPGQPQFWAEFSDWNLKPRINAKTFKFQPPEDAHQIAFAIQFPALVEAAGIVSGSTTGD